MKNRTKNCILYFVLFTSIALKGMINPNEPLGSLLTRLSQDKRTLLNVLPRDVIQLIRACLNPWDIVYQECKIMSVNIPVLTIADAQKIENLKQCGMSKIEDYFRALIEQHVRGQKKENVLLKFIHCSNIFWYFIREYNVNVNRPIAITRYIVVDHYDEIYTEEDTYLMNAVRNATHEKANPLDRKIGLAVVKRLIAAGANVNLFDKYHTESPLHIAAKRKPSAEAKDDYLALTSELLQAGANPNTPNAAGFNVLFKALEYNNDVILPLLLKYKADPCDNCRGHTPLCLAAEACSPQLTQMLLSARADVNEKNAQGKSPLDIAREKGKKTHIGILLRAKDQTQKPTTIESLSMKFGWY